MIISSITAGRYLQIENSGTSDPSIGIAYQNLQKASNQLKATFILSEDESLETHR